MKIMKTKPAVSSNEMGDRFDEIVASTGLGSRKPKPKVVGVGAAVVVAGGLIGALMFGSGRDSQQVIVATHAIDAGSVLTSADMKGVEVSGQLGFRATSAGNLETLIGKVAAVPIAAGTLIVAEQLQLRQSAPIGKVLVGMVLDPGALPSPDLRFGDRVQVLATSNPNAVVDEPAAVMTDATVWRVWGGLEGSGRRTVTLAVPSGVATQVGDAAARNLIRLLGVPNEQSSFEDITAVMPTQEGSPIPTTAGATATSDPTAATVPGGES
jgi:SAF domain